jgi:hypothetical protein
MLNRPSEHRLTLEERVAVVVGIAVAVGVHLVIFLGGSGIGYLAREEKKRERLMVIRRVREITPGPEIAVRIPDSRRVQVAAEPAPESTAGRAAAPKPEQKVAEHGTLPPKAEITPKMEEDLQEGMRKEEQAKSAELELAAQKAAEVGGSSVSVVTDLPAASFTLSGPVEYRGTGTFWIRRGTPPGTYRISFSAVDGFNLPPPQTKELQKNGQVVFVAKYRRSTEVVVESNEPAAQFTIFRPDGRPLDMVRLGREFFDNLPLGNYTAVFKVLPGRTAPAPISRTLTPGGKLSFYGEYREVSSRRDSEAGEEGAAAGGPGKKYGAGRESESGSGTGNRGEKSRAKTASGPKEAGLDRRVQMVVTSYPPSPIEDDHGTIPYPEVIIRKSDFQQGWCQVYLILSVSDHGEVLDVAVERPRPEERPRYAPLIKAVEDAVRSWDYDKVRAEVHVDVRFYVEK